MKTVYKKYILSFLLFFLWILVQKSISLNITSDKYSSLWRKSAGHFLSKGGHGLFWDTLFLQNSSANIVNGLNITKNCEMALLETKYALKGHKLWALKMLDASGKGFSGVLQGTVVSFGDYDQCLDIVTTTTKNVQDSFEGSHCMLKLFNEISSNSSQWFGALDLTDEQILENRFGRIPFAYGACLPSLCTNTDIKILAEYYLKPHFWQIKEEPRCSTKKSIQFRFHRLSNVQKLAFIYLSSVIFCVFLATLQDLTSFSSSNNAKLSFKVVFSLKANWTRLWSTDEKISPAMSRVRAIDLWRFIFLTFEILCHSVTLAIMDEGIYIYANQDNVGHLARLWTFQPLISLNSQQLMFCLSGASASVSALRLLSSKGSVVKNGIKHVLRRWLILTPILAFVMALQVLMPFATSGPAYDHTMASKADKCAKHGWRTLAMVSNWDYPLNMCIPVMWSVSVDFQLNLLLTLTVILISKRKNLGILFASTLIILGILLPTFSMYSLNLSPPGLIPLKAKEMVVSFMKLHYSTSAQLTAFFAPFLPIYARYSGLKLHLSKKTQRRIFIVLVTFSIGTCFENAPWNVLGFKRNHSAFILIEFFRRPLFLLPVVWAALCLSDFNPERIWTPKAQALNLANRSNQVKPPSYFYLLVSRLLASTYWAHQFFIIIDHLSSRRPLSTDLYSVVMRGLWSVFGSLLFGLLFFHFFLGPFTYLVQSLTVTKKLEKTN